MVAARRLGLLATGLTSTLVASFALIGAGAETAHGAQPNNQACLGADFSTYAREGSAISGSGAGFGQFNASLAQYVPGLGFPIQVHLAGGIPDAYVVNSCNNP